MKSLFTFAAFAALMVCPVLAIQEGSTPTGQEEEATVQVEESA